jgi:hypothetical protein
MNSHYIFKSPALSPAISNEMHKLSAEVKILETDIAVLEGNVRTFLPQNLSEIERIRAIHAQTDLIFALKEAYKEFTNFNFPLNAMPQKQLQKIHEISEGVFHLRTITAFACHVQRGQTSQRDIDIFNEQNQIIQSKAQKQNRWSHLFKALGTFCLVMGLTTLVAGLFTGPVTLAVGAGLSLLGGVLLGAGSELESRPRLSRIEKAAKQIQFFHSVSASPPQFAENPYLPPGYVR